MHYIIDKDIDGQQQRARDITHIVIWDDVYEQTEAIRKLLKYRTPKSLGVKVPPGPSWCGRTDFRDWDTILKLVTEPWAEGMEVVTDMLEQLEHIELPVPKSIRRRCAWRDNDGDFDLDRFTSGQDAFRGTVKRDMSGQQFITLAVQIGANGWVGHRDILWRGACAVAMTNILERQGYSVEIIGYDMGLRVFRSGQSLMNCTWVKRFEHPFDMSAIINALSAWYFRIINWASYHCVKEQTVSPGFGSEAVANNRILEIATNNPEAWQIREVWSKEAAIELATKYLTELVDPDFAESADLVGVYDGEEESEGW